MILIVAKSLSLKKDTKKASSINRLRKLRLNSSLYAKTPSKRDRMLQSITELNTSTKKDKIVKILLIIDIPPRILANVICPRLYMLAYTISGSGAGRIYYIMPSLDSQLIAYKNKWYTYCSIFLS